MKEIIFTTNHEPVLSFADKDFKTKYEERVGNNPDYIQVVNGETKHLALCPLCNNPVAILGIYKKIDVAPHARHAKGINIPNVVQYNEYKFQNCPYHKKRANYIKEYVPETEEPQRHSTPTVAGFTSTVRETCHSISYRYRTASDWDGLQYALPGTGKVHSWGQTMPRSFSDGCLPSSKVREKRKR